MTEKFKRCLVVRDPTIDLSYGRFGHVTGFVSHLHPTKPFETQMFADHVHNVEFTSQCSDVNNAWYGYNIFYSDNRRNTLHEAQRAVKVLAPIERKMAELYNTFGRPANIGQWVSHLAIAIKSDAIVVYCKNSQFYDEPWRVYRNNDRSLAIDAINKLADIALATVTQIAA